MSNGQIFIIVIIIIIIIMVIISIMIIIIIINIHLARVAAYSPIVHMSNSQIAANFAI